MGTVWEHGYWVGYARGVEAASRRAQQEWLMMVREAQDRAWAIEQGSDSEGGTEQEQDDETEDEE